MKMGCCFSCNDDDDLQGNETSERARLLQDPVSNTAVVTVPQSSDSRAVGNVSGSHPQRDQEDELAKILQETLSAMIDVSGSGSHSLDQREFQERTRHYMQKVQTLSPTLLRPPNLLLGDVPNPEKHLGAPLISQEDIDLMEWAMDEVEAALDSIRVVHNEDLVVPFGAKQEPALSATD